QWHLDVVDRAHPRDQVERLKDKADLPVANPGELVLGQVGDVIAVEDVGARAREVEAADDVHQRALAGARRSHDRDEFSFRDMERDTFERRDLDVAGAVELGDPLEGDHPPAPRKPPPPPRPPRPRTVPFVVVPVVRKEGSTTWSPAFRPPLISV